MTESNNNRASEELEIASGADEDASTPTDSAEALFGSRKSNESDESGGNHSEAESED